MALHRYLKHHNPEEYAKEIEAGTVMHERNISRSAAEMFRMIKMSRG